jgi:uncharacterized membrane protein
MLGALLALASAATFAINNTTARRGVLSGSVLQALVISMPMGIPMFWLAAWIGGAAGEVFGFTAIEALYLSAAGIVHFVAGRYCNYRAVKAIGSNLVGPLQETNMLLALALAIVFLGEKLTVLKLIGIGLVMIGPALLATDKKVTRSSASTFQPVYAEGYFYGILSVFCYGVSPVLVRLAVEGKSLGASQAGGVISYMAATVATALILLFPGALRHSLAVPREAAKWFTWAGFSVGAAHMFRFMALAIAPVSVVSPIQRLSIILRVMFSWMINREHEVFSSRMYLATGLSLVGALFLTINTKWLLEVLGIAGPLAELLLWSWP